MPEAGGRGGALAGASLALFLTRSNSLATWGRAGMLDRETALYRALAPNLAEVRYVSYGGPGDSRYCDPAEGVKLTLNRWRLPLAAYIWYLRKIWRAPKGCIIKSNQVQGAEVALGAARRQGLRFIARCGYLTSDFMRQRHGPDSPQARVAGELERRVFNGADRVVVTTEAMADEVTGSYGVSREKVRVIPNYVDTDAFAPRPGAARNKGELLFIGRLAEQKNPVALLDALKGLEASLVMVGDGPLRQSLEDKARREKLPVKFMGNLPHKELPALMHRAEAFVLPSLYEGHPKSLLEAMGAGMAVVAGRGPGLEGLIQQGVNGLLCGHEPGQIREALVMVLADGRLRRRLGAKAREFVENGFSLRRVVEMELALYGELAQ